MLANQARREEERWEEYGGEDQKGEGRGKILTYLSMAEGQDQIWLTGTAPRAIHFRSSARSIKTRIEGTAFDPLIERPKFTQHLRGDSVRPLDPFPIQDLTSYKKLLVSRLCRMS